MTIPVDPRCLTIAHAVRVALETLFPRRRGCRNLCTLSACAIVGLCRPLRIPAEVIGGHYLSASPITKPQFGNTEHIAASRTAYSKFPHAWVKHRRNYIDITATQFDPEAERVVVLPIPDARYQGEFEPLEFATALLPVCGSSEEELAALVRLAKSVLRDGS